MIENKIVWKKDTSFSSFILLFIMIIKIGLTKIIGGRGKKKENKEIKWQKNKWKTFTKNNDFKKKNEIKNTWAEKKVKQNKVLKERFF